MKNLRLLTIICFAIVGMFIISCNPDHLTNKNKNPDQIEKIIPEYAFTGSLLEAFPLRHSSISQGMQYYSTYKEVPAGGDKFYSFSMTGNFNTYRDELNRLMQITNALKDDPNNVNKLAAVKMLSILHYHGITDRMGDVPYTEAMQGIENRKPKYDTQESIYLSMLNELDAAIKSMDDSKPNVFGKADIFFGGNLAKWKKFGYSLMMRIGMRMSEIKPALAQQWVEKAAAGGVIKDIEDIAYIKFADVIGQYNPRSNSLITGDYSAPGGDNVEGGKFTKRFIDHLKDTKDPRLYVVSVVWVPLGTTPPTYRADTVAANQRGMLSGSINGRPPDFDTYSEPSLLYLYRGSPIVVFGHAEAYLMLAEAALRGWNVGITDAEAYEKAVRAAMETWKLWPDVAPHTGVIPASDVNAYLAKNPYGGTYEEKMEQIATQYWVSMFDNEFQVWCNWRRIKYPVFNYANWKNTDGSFSSYPGNVTGGKMYRRYSLPVTEKTLNTVNFKEALQRQGFKEEYLDNLLTRMWWDTEARGNGQSNTN